MEDAQGMSENDKEQLAEDVETSVGEPEGSGDEINQSHESQGHETVGDPLYVQKRLKQQKRAHEREMREMQARMADMQARMEAPKQDQYSDANLSHGSQGNPGNIEEAIHKAVSFALQAKDAEERKMKDAATRADIANEYQELQRHLDHTSDKYEDFDEVVRGNRSPFTETIRDTAILLPKQGPGSAGEVLYKLGKNPEDLERISKLPPHKQAAEVVKLSHAMAKGDEQKGSQSRPLGQVKANPVTNSVGVTDKTPPSQIRALMKAGKFR